MKIWKTKNNRKKIKERKIRNVSRKEGNETGRHKNEGKTEKIEKGGKERNR